MGNADNGLESGLHSDMRYTQGLLAAGKPREALESARRLAERHAADPRPWQLLSNLHARMGRWQDAVDCARQACFKAPGDPDTLLMLAQCLLGGGRRRAALTVAERLLPMSVERAEWNDSLGTLLTYCDDPVAGRDCFERALAQAPGHSGYLYNLATAQRMIGDTALAEASLNAVIARDPGDIRAYYTRADLRTQTADHNHIEEMVRVLRSRVRRPQDEVMLRFAIAKELEDVAQYDESFDHLRRACDLHRRSIRYDVHDDVSAIDRIIQSHDATIFREGAGIDTEECIFVFGLPRSGTTLVERILASHSAVRAAGELQAFPAETIRAVQRICPGPVGKQEFSRRALDVDPRALAQAYLDAARLEDGGAARFVDKQPLNYLYAGLIVRALPRARIVALARDPMDSCYAMLKTLFAGAYPFTYDLIDLGRYYIAWHRLMQHWHSVLGENLLIVDYEDLVQNQETVTRRIIEHCGLAWEDSCLAFQHQRTPVTTASAVQVRQAMYSSSIGKWRHFEQHLAPLAQLLERHQPPGGWRLGPSPTP